ncbi:hypothetical protein [Planotetraspora mira]|uniref:hypothetical protein n=1 Tax=Planotetraspora mira TaxID=58121 RepID=UPI001951E85C|nr:hypothetical protein [Planotetraspora mira]
MSTSDSCRAAEAALDVQTSVAAWSDVGPLVTSSRNEPSGSATVRDEGVVAPSTGTSLPEVRASVEADALSTTDRPTPFDGPLDVAEADGTSAIVDDVVTRTNAAKVAAALRTAG